MKFLNKGEALQVRQNEGSGRYKWILLKPGETIDLPEDSGVSYGFEKVTEEKIEKKKVETKQLEKKNIGTFDKDFLKELEEINGIGKKTAKDIYKVFRNKQKLKESISHDDELPFRDDIEIKLRQKYG